LVGKPEGKRPLCRPKCGWEDGIRMNVWLAGEVWSVFSWLRIGAGGDSGATKLVMLSEVRGGLPQMVETHLEYRQR
jgi:hypothetical protein